MTTPVLDAPPPISADERAAPVQLDRPPLSRSGGRRLGEAGRRLRPWSDDDPLWVGPSWLAMMLGTAALYIWGLSKASPRWRWSLPPYVAGPDPPPGCWPDQPWP